PPADSRWMILYLPRIVSSAAIAAAPPPAACATLASVSARDRISVRCAISLELAGGALVLALRSGSSASCGSWVRVTPPHTVQTCSASVIGQVARSSVALSREIRPHSSQRYGTSTEAIAMFRASVIVSPTWARNYSLTSTTVTDGTCPARLLISRRHSFWPLVSNRDTSARSITTSPSAPTRNGRARNIAPIVPMIRKYVTEPWTSLMIRGGFSAAPSVERYSPSCASSWPAAGWTLVAAYLVMNAK